MNLEILNTCKIFVDNEKDFISLSKSFGGSSVSISKETPNFDSKIPILIIGFSLVQKHFPEQKIRDRNVCNNVWWTFSSEENKSVFKTETKSFAKKSIDNFLQIPFVSYDAILDGDFNIFAKQNIQKDGKYYVYFHKNAMYLYGGKKIIVISLKSLEYIGKDITKIVVNILNNIDCMVFNYTNINNFVDFNEVKKLISLENVYWTKFGEELSYRLIMSLFRQRDINRYMSFLMSVLDNYKLDEEEDRSCLRQAYRDIITNWLSTRKIFFKKEYIPDRTVKVKWENYRKFTTSKYSNKRAITGRIYCVSGFNPQNLPKKSDIREQIISRYDGGKIVVFDYTSFETILSLYFSKNKEFIDKYKDKDLHVETAKVAFDVEVPNAAQRVVGKNVNHAIIYGGGDTTIMRLLEGVSEKKAVLNKIKLFLEPILDIVEYTNSINKEVGYLKSNFGLIVRPTKDYAAYNNYIQLTASEIVVNKLYEIKEFLENKKAHLMFQVHDSFVFDFHPSEFKQIEELKKILQTYQGFSFPIICKKGIDYSKCV